MLPAFVPRNKGGCLPTLAVPIFLNMKTLICAIAIGVISITSAYAQTFTFECVCDNISGANCDICNTVTQSRFFCGLIVKRNGVPVKWIDSPYIIKWNGTTAHIQEIIPAAESISISMIGTAFTSLDSFKLALMCPCIANPSVVDTPIIGNGSPGSPITIGQFGADTSDVLIWNGKHWYPGKVGFGSLLVDLPYYLNDQHAISDGLVVGDPYLLDCGNTLGMPSGVFKVVKICGYECGIALKYFRDDWAAIAGGVPIGQQYLIDESNPYGVQNGFVKLVALDSIFTNDTLVCEIEVDYYINDLAALVDGKEIGDLYATSAANTYGAPAGMERAVSLFSSTMADVPNCCSLDATLPFYANDTVATGDGLSSGNWYYLSQSNTYGYPYSTKKQVQ